MRGKTIGILVFSAVFMVFSMMSLHTWLTSREDAELLKNVYSKQLSLLLAGINKQSVELVNDYFDDFEAIRARSASGPLKALYQFENNRLRLVSGEQSDQQEKWLSIWLELEKSASITSDVFFLDKTERLLVLGKKSSHSVLVLELHAFIRNDIIPMIQLLSDENIRFRLSEYREDDERELFSSGLIDTSYSLVQQEVWFLPDLQLTVQMQSESLQNLTRTREIRSWLMVSLLIVIIGFTVIIVMRAWKKEQHMAQLKTDFVANVSHELITPLALIRMNAETLSLGRIPTEEKRQHYLRVIEQEAERLGHLINNVLNFSKMDAGKKEFKAERISIQDVVMTVEDTYRLYVERLGFVFEVIYPKHDCFIMANKNDLMEVLLNLMDNAVKYSPDKKCIQIRVQEEFTFISLTVQDKGLGIPKSWQKSIFEPFVRVENSLTQKTKGTGLGLSLVKKMVEAYGGTILLESEPEQGTSITLTFPKA